MANIFTWSLQMYTAFKSQTLACVALCCLSLACYGKQVPNIVLILSDDQAWDDYSFMGSETIQTPNLDALARNGVLFKRGYVPTALCRPSLLTIATGHHAHTHGVTGNDPSRDIYGAKNSETQRQARAALIAKVDKIKTLPELLRSKGYVSFQSGKWWEGSYKRGGFDEGMTRGFPKKGGRHGDDGLKIGREGMKEITSFIDRSTANKKPFMVWYAPFLPHTPHNPPPRLFDKYNDPNKPASIAKYEAMCDWFDETCGELLGYLDKKNLRENTLVVYVTDNGWITSNSTSSFLPRSKQSPSEGGVRTPIIFSWPGKLAPQNRSELVSSIDIVPTILGAAGVAIPKDLPGRNLMPALLAKTPLQENIIFGEGFAHDIADIHDAESSLLYRWVIEGDWKLILSYDGETDFYEKKHVTLGEPLLYHLATDPHENTNLIRQYPEIAKRLSQKIDGWYPLKKRKVLTAKVK